MLSLYPYEVDLRMYNPLDSHDTVRFLTYCGGNEDSHRLAVALQMTFPVPCRILRRRSRHGRRQRSGLPQGDGLGTG